MLINKSRLHFIDVIANHAVVLNCTKLEIIKYKSPQHFKVDPVFEIDSIFQSYSGIRISMMHEGPVISRVSSEKGKFIHFREKGSEIRRKIFAFFCETFRLLEVMRRQLFM